MLARLLALMLLLSTPAQARTLWEGDFAGNWMARWDVTWIGKQGVPLRILDDPDHGAFLRVDFPPGALKEGFNFRTDLSRYIGRREEVYLSYFLRFSDGFEWRHGGKLPGLMTHRHGPITGCQMPDGTGGFSTRFTWGRDGRINVYPYVPPQEAYPPNPNGCGRPYALSERAERGRWIHLVQMVRLNTPGRSDGVVRAWFDGKPALELTGIRFRDTGFGIDGILFANFFGGRCCAPDEPGSHIDFAAFSLHDTNPLGD